MEPSPALERDSPVRAPDTRVAHVLYLLHGLAPFTAWTLAVVAVIIGIFTRDNVRGAWVETHYSWLMRTFWWSLLGIVVGWILFFTFIGIPLAVLLWIALGIWYLYRVIRGWLLLNDGKPAPD
jgi:uncharacterized membrane protein